MCVVLLCLFRAICSCTFDQLKNSRLELKCSFRTFVCSVVLFVSFSCFVLILNEKTSAHVKEQKSHELNLYKCCCCWTKINNNNNYNNNKGATLHYINITSIHISLSSSIPPLTGFRLMCKVGDFFCLTLCFRCRPERSIIVSAEDLRSFSGFTKDSFSINHRVSFSVMVRVGSCAIL